MDTIFAQEQYHMEFCTLNDLLKRFYSIWRDGSPNAFLQLGNFRGMITEYAAFNVPS